MRGGAASPAAGPSGEAPPLSLGVFLGKARALLLNVGIIRHNKAVVSGALRRLACAPPIACASSCIQRPASSARFVSLRLLGSLCSRSPTHTRYPFFPAACPACPAPAASHINEYLSRPDGAPSSVGRIDEKDMADVPRFLNR